MDGQLEVHRIVAPAAAVPEGGRALYADGGRFVGRRTLSATSRVSLDSYANGFPAAAWRRWAPGAAAHLTFTASGSGEVLVRAVGAGRPAEGEVVARAPAGAERCTTTVTLPEDADWVWIELEPGPLPLELVDAAVSLTTVPRPVVLGVAVTTFDRPADVAALLAGLAGEPGEQCPADHVVVVDQGTRLATDDPAFAPAADRLGARLHVVHQANLGGSGGFSRGMLRCVELGATHVLLLDDDVRLDAEAVRRLRAAAEAGAPGLVGGQMLSLTEPTVLHSTAEVVDHRDFRWRTAPGALSRVDLASAPSRIGPFVRPADPDYNGWWMCLLPAAAIERVGLALPMFIKWDDVEYGLRAAAAGFRTDPLPGVGLWHMPWTAKDTSVDWQAYYLARNRLVAAAIHHDGRPEGLVGHLLATVGSHLVTMSYSSALLTVVAMEDALAGPEALIRSQRAGAGPVRALVAGCPDAEAHPLAELGAFAPRRVRPRPAIAWAPVDAARALVRSCAADLPPTRVPSGGARWNEVGGLDAIAVVAADGRTATLRRRDAGEARALARRAASAAWRLVRHWPRLREQYRQAAPTLAAPESWRDIWTDSEPPR